MLTPAPVGIEIIIIACLVVVAGHMAHGSRRHRRALSRLPIRIHVNGTRGKSSVTRLIAAGFRGCGYRTIAKTTGTAARLILEDETEYDVGRATAAILDEQFDIIEFAASRGAEVLVIECMAVKPEFQLASQQDIVRGTCSVVTNVRPDHQEEMGETLPQIAWCLGTVAPAGGALVTAETDPELCEVLRARAAQVGARLVRSDAADSPTIAEFGREEFPENIALALQVCELHGLDRETALLGMEQAAPDPGCLPTMSLTVRDTPLRFVNAFAANDYESTEQIINDVRDRSNGNGLYLVVNCRADRPRRTVDMAKLLSNGFNLDGAFLIGDGKQLLHQMMRRRPVGYPIKVLADDDASRLLDEIGGCVSPEASVVGVGNILGAATPLCELIAQEGRPFWSP